MISVQIVVVRSPHLLQQLGALSFQSVTLGKKIVTLKVSPQVFCVRTMIAKTNRFWEEFLPEVRLVGG